MNFGGRFSTNDCTASLKSFDFTKFIKDMSTW